MIIQHEDTNTVLTEQDLIDIYMEGYMRAINEVGKSGSTVSADNAQPWEKSFPFNPEDLNDMVKYQNYTPTEARRELYFKWLKNKK